jgi:RecB family exonuclease
MFSGKVDCVAKLNNGETVIIDWKTASKNYMPSKVKKDKQLTFYRWLVDKDYPLAFVVANKETGEVQWHDTIRSQGQIDTALQMAIRAHQEMQEREEFRGVYNNKCDYCEYNGTYCGGNVGDF